MGETLTGAEAVVRSLEAHGVEIVFGVPGIHALSLYDAVARSTQIRHVLVRHEQAATMCADAFARVTGRPGVAFVTTGPGCANCLTGVMEAWGASSPVLVITSQISSAYLGKHKGALHEVRDQPGMFASVTRTAVTVDDPQAISVQIHQAFEDMFAGRPRPVMREFPTDQLSATWELEVAGHEIPRRRPAASETALARATDALRQARRPVIISGGGVVHSHAEDEVLRLAELLHAPVLTNVMGRGSVPDDHPLVRGPMGRGGLALETLTQADTILAIGLRFTELDCYQWRLEFADGAKLIHIDVDSTTFDRNYPATVAICADARTALRQILDVLTAKPLRGRRPSIAALRKEKHRYENLLRDNGHLGLQYVDAIRKAVTRNGIVCCDETMVTYWACRHLPVYESRTFLYPEGSATLGYALPAAIAAKIARPDRQVIALAGDGGFMFTVQELATAMEQRLSIPVIVFNDRGFTVLKWLQDVFHEGRHTAVDYHVPDLLALAKAFGVGSERVDTPRRLRSAIQRALTADGPTLIEVPVQLDAPFFL